MIEANEKMIGKKVRYVVDRGSIYDPPKGTVGVIKNYDEFNCLVQWPEDSTEVGQGDCWWCNNLNLELVEQQTPITDKEIWEILKGVMEDNGLKSRCSRVETLKQVSDDCFSFKPIDMYDATDVKKAVAIAYRLGYERASNNLPFKIEEGEYED